MNEDQITMRTQPPAGGRLATGVEVIKRYLAKLGTSPGVYRMLTHAGDVLYVGKANNLRNRVASYTRPAKLPIRIQRMIAQTETMEFIVTHTEVEALLLENNLIKKLKPRYNVLLRDDKTFADILITGDHDYPQVIKHRGSRDQKGDYFGPFASAAAVNRTITALQRTFLLRNCSDGVFAHRTRPCLQYQIKRCSAPCVDFISREDYAVTVAQAKAFLQGRGSEIHAGLAKKMQEASDDLNFEKAAEYRDRIQALAQIQSHQDINMAGVSDADVMALYFEGGQTCIQVFFFRGGRNNGNRSYFPSHDKQVEPGTVLASFIGQFYDNKPSPPLILTNVLPDEQALLEEALSQRVGRKVQIIKPARGDKRKMLDHALNNARDALGRKLAESASQRKLLDGLAEKLRLDTVLNRVEVYDNSHNQGSSAIGAMIVAGPDGFMKNAYRKFNIKTAGKAVGEHGGDDYQMMREVLTRRFSRAIKENPDRDDGSWPELVIVDGGAGQLAVAEEVFEELGLTGEIALLGVAKGPERNAGRERLHLPGKAPFMLEPRDPVLYFIQRLRDESHRFAIGTHRTKRKKDMAVNPLDEIPGIGAKRKKALLMHFGSAKAVTRAGLADLEKVEGISQAVAKKIYGFFHPDS
ncbi:excinuclease ABC subunit C [Aestuariispira insulae]|uniref:UvrABC system protein C n=2 Tax=Aestuariispira insulae TaxID=1461337 RepID=A0A3D9HY83_9PROT|nr:excinuclease ABC subunit C [Aestuariispira insulae]